MLTSRTTSLASALSSPHALAPVASRRQARLSWAYSMTDFEEARPLISGSWSSRDMESPRNSQSRRISSVAAAASNYEPAASLASGHMCLLASSGAALLLLFSAPQPTPAIEVATGTFTMDQAMSKDFELPSGVAPLISPVDAQALMAKGVQYLDVRTEEEFVHGHPPGATNIPFMLKGPDGLVPNPHFTTKLTKDFPNKLRPIIVGCQSGKRSTPATVMMEHNGYSNLYNLQGGFPKWVEAGLPIVAEVIEEEE